MKVVIDIECDKLINPTQIWCIVCKDIDTGQYYYFRNVTTDEDNRKNFRRFAEGTTLWIGHNFLGYDYPVLTRLLAICVPEISSRCIDTLILSKLVDYSREHGHSIEAYGIEFNFEKGKNYYVDFFKQWSQELEDYCVRDVDICHRIYAKYLDIVHDPAWASSIALEHQFQLVCNSLHNNGFAFNADDATRLLGKVIAELKELDDKILKQFPPRQIVTRVFTPKATKYGTINQSSIPKTLRANIHEYEIGKEYPLYAIKEFNPASHKQVIEVLNEAGWAPYDKTQTHINVEREINRLKYTQRDTKELDLATLSARLIILQKSGWKINENNLSTLPPSAPSPARTLAKRILLESRRRTLTEWINLVCTEVKIEKKSIEELGHAISERMIQRGVPRNKNIIEKDVEKETLKCLDDLFDNSSDITFKKKEKEDIILNLTTDFLSKTLIKWLQTKGVDVYFVKENENYLWITITPQKKSEVSYARDVTPLLDGLRKIWLLFSITSERIKGEFQGIGAWTHRMAHQKPNTANIPNDLKEDGSKKLLGKELRSLWQVPSNRLLVGVDAEGIQLRIFAHYIDDKEFTDALVKGKKGDRTDPHSLNKRILGSVCKSRQAAKRFIYALLLGAGLQKLAQVLECSRTEAQEALDRVLQRYSGFARLKRTIIPKDAKRGYFIGLDGRKVRIPGETASERNHLCMSGYLQNGEAIIMKRATVKWHDTLQKNEALLVDLVHDEWQTEVPNDMVLARTIAEMQAASLTEVGEDLGLKCPLAGSYYNDDQKAFTIGNNWYQTH